MFEIIIENLVEIFASLLIALVGVLGAWITARIGKNEKLKSITAAMDEVIRMAQLTVEELQQTTVDGLKAAHEDKKLTADEISMLGNKLIEGTINKMSAPAAELLNAVGVDVIALIKSAGESWVSNINNW